ncbi:PstS family phosphate ABC transporter substrate-binding protein [Scytonema sp. PRP1]|uniref:PstS family phosphate ABC transporter substrate-binding protein n=1 Tax=Scytonema sp. PRP1 TaxID=3120513 RepID=UPI002FD64130
MITEKDKKDIFNYVSSINSELEKKVHSPTTVTEEVLSWTSFQRELTKKIFEIILEQSEPFIPQGQEKERVDRLVRSHLIEEWEFQEASEHLRQIQNLIVNSRQSARLLKRYQRILQRGEVQSDNSPEDMELLRSGLVSVIGGRLKVSNRIYEAVFNWSWVTQELNKNNRPVWAFIRQRRQSRLVLWVILSMLALFTAIASPQVIDFSKPIGFIDPISNPQGQRVDNNLRTFKKVQVPEGLFSYGGSTSFVPIYSPVEQAIENAQPQFQLRYLSHPTGAYGSNIGIKMLLDGQLTFSLSSRGLKPVDHESAQQRNFTLSAIPVAIDAIAVAVNPDLNLNGITIDQLKGIYTGKFTNWIQVGGPDLPITAYSRREEDSGTVKFFEENILGENGKFGPNVKFIPITTNALQKVIKNPGGIYYGSAPEVVPQCWVKSLPIGRQLTQLVPPYKGSFVPPSQCSEQQRNQLNKEAFKSGQYPITRHLFVIVKQNGQDEERAGKAYANLLRTDQGQELIEKAGFVRIR